MSINKSSFDNTTDVPLTSNVMQPLAFSVSQADNNMTVVLDTNLTEELIEEGFVREVISKIQTMRKEADFEVTDKIVIYVSGNDKVSGIVKANANSIMSDVMALDIKVGELAGYSKEWNINGETVSIGVEK